MPESRALLAHPLLLDKVTQLLPECAEIDAFGQATHVTHVHRYIYL